MIAILDHVLMKHHAPLGDQEINAIIAKLRAGEQFEKPKDFPKIVCLCGSTRFPDIFQRANLEETLAGKIVLSIGCNLRDDDVFNTFTEDHKKEIKLQLDELHKRKIDLADEVFILNFGGYVGESTKNEIRYALALGKPIKWLELFYAHRNIREVLGSINKENQP